MLADWSDFVGRLGDLGQSLWVAFRSLPAQAQLLHAGATLFLLVFAVLFWTPFGNRRVAVKCMILAVLLHLLAWEYLDYYEVKGTQQPATPKVVRIPLRMPPNAPDRQALARMTPLTDPRAESVKPPELQPLDRPQPAPAEDLQRELEKPETPLSRPDQLPERPDEQLLEPLPVTSEAHPSPLEIETVAPEAPEAKADPAVSPEMPKEQLQRSTVEALVSLDRALAPITPAPAERPVTASADLDSAPVEAQVVVAPTVVPDTSPKAILPKEPEAKADRTDVMPAPTETLDLASRQSPALPPQRQVVVPSTPAASDALRRVAQPEAQTQTDPRLLRGATARATPAPGMVEAPAPEVSPVPVSQPVGLLPEGTVVGRRSFSSVSPRRGNVGRTESAMANGVSMPARPAANSPRVSTLASPATLPTAIRGQPAAGSGIGSLGPEAVPAVPLAVPADAGNKGQPGAPGDGSSLLASLMSSDQASIGRQGTGDIAASPIRRRASLSGGAAADTSGATAALPGRGEAATVSPTPRGAAGGSAKGPAVAAGAGAVLRGSSSGRPRVGGIAAAPAPTSGGSKMSGSATNAGSGDNANSGGGGTGVSYGVPDGQGTVARRRGASIAGPVRRRMASIHTGNADGTDNAVEHLLARSRARTKDGLADAASGEDSSIWHYRTAPNRLDIVFRHGGSIQSEEAVMRALVWLAEHQHPQGYWDSDGFSDRCPPGDKCSAPAFETGSDTGLTGLAVLAFLGAGHTHLQSDEFQETVRRGLSWLLRVQLADGDLRGQGRIYCHCMATLALNEAYALSKDERLRLPAQSATDWLAQAQHRESGGWRYAPGQFGDTSVFGWAVMALRAARNANLRVSEQTWTRAQRWLPLVSSGTHGGLAAYQPGGNVSHAMTAETLVCRQIFGATPSDPVMDEACDLLLTRLPSPDDYHLYYWYYGTLSMFQVGGERWRKWNEALLNTLLSTQHRSGHATGSWTPQRPFGVDGGRVFTTACSALCLEVYYRYLPLYVTSGGS